MQCFDPRKPFVPLAAACHGLPRWWVSGIAARSLAGLPVSTGHREPIVSHFVSVFSAKRGKRRVSIPGHENFCVNFRHFSLFGPSLVLEAA
jgi:hypothetical protein